MAKKRKDSPDSTAKPPIAAKKALVCKKPETAKRNELGYFGKGNSAALGNAGGCGKPHEARKAAAQFFAGFVDEAGQLLRELLHDDDPAVRLRAVQVVFAYAYGRPRQTFEIQSGWSDAVRETIIDVRMDFVREASAQAIAGQQKDKEGSNGAVHDLPRGGGEGAHPPDQADQDGQRPLPAR